LCCNRIPEIDLFDHTRQIDVDKLERVRKKATRLIPVLSKKSYSDQLQVLKELFKIINGTYDSACVPHLEFVELSNNLIRTRGNNFKLVQHHCHYDLRKNALLTVLFRYGTVCLVLLFLQKLLTPLKPSR